MDRTGQKEESIGGGEHGGKKHLIHPPDVEVKGDVRFDSQFVFLRWLKYTVVCAIIVLEQLAVQKPEKKGDGEFRLIMSSRLGLGEESIFRTGRETLIKRKIYFYRTNPRLEMISAWQSLTVSPLRLSSSPLTQRFPDRKKTQEKHIQCQTTQQCNASRFCCDLILL